MASASPESATLTITRGPRCSITTRPYVAWRLLNDFGRLCASM